MNVLQKKRTKLCLLIISIVVMSIFMTASVKPLDYGPSDVVAAVNSLRAEYGLTPYGASGELNGICQDQAEYMASINTLTHDREDDSTIPTTAENIAYGPISRAMDSWVDDQLHFDTLTAWSAGAAGAGIAEAGNAVYICFNMNRSSDAEYNPIPFTQEPGETPSPTLVPTDEPIVEDQPTEESSPVEEESEGAADETGTDDVPEATVEGATPVAVVLEEDAEGEPETEDGEPTEEPVEIDTTTVQPQAIAFESKTGKTIAYVLMGVGVLGLGGSIYGMVWGMKNMGGKKKSSVKKTRPAKQTKAKKKKRSGKQEEFPNEAQEE